MRVGERKADQGKPEGRLEGGGREEEEERERAEICVQIPTFGSLI